MKKTFCILLTLISLSSYGETGIEKGSDLIKEQKYTQICYPSRDLLPQSFYPSEEFERGDNLIDCPECFVLSYTPNFTEQDIIKEFSNRGFIRKSETGFPALILTKKKKIILKLTEESWYSSAIESCHDLSFIRNDNGAEIKATTKCMLPPLRSIYYVLFNDHEYQCLDHDKQKIKINLNVWYENNN